MITGKWCRDFESYAKEQNISKKMYMWYTPCPKCATKYGKNYVAHRPGRMSRTFVIRHIHGQRGRTTISWRKIAACAGEAHGLRLAR